VTSQQDGQRYDATCKAGSGKIAMKTRLLLSVTVAAGLAFAPLVLAQDTLKPAMSKKAHKPAKVHKTTGKSSGKMRKNDGIMGEPYSTQKDEMTR
jgi:hypothetical protein